MKKAIWVLLSCLLLVSLVIASCSKSSTSSTAIVTSSTTAATKTTTTTTTTTPSSATTSITTSTTTKVSTTSVTTSGNWWDQNPQPQYGGTLTFRSKQDIVNFDPAGPGYLTSVFSIWMEKLHNDSWVVDPSVFGFKTNFRPPEFVQGQIAQSWEMTDPSTYVVHLRQGVRWQNIAPANGRELVASDVVAHYTRVFGINGGTPNPFFGWSPFSTLVKSVTAPDKYTVVFKWNSSNVEMITETQQEIGNEQCIENPEAVALWGNLTDWRHSIGTGAFLISDFVSGSGVTVTKNPNYWGFDERYPQNRLPYIDTLRILVIPDDTTAISALRTGKIDAMANLQYTDAQTIRKSNPELIQSTTPAATGLSVDPRNDVKPYNDINVRKALQMAIDLPTIASSYYGGTTDASPLTLTSYYLTGWGSPYAEWPQSLKDEYAYNPTAAKKLLSDAGYPNGFNTDVVADNSADLDLLQTVKSYFAKINVNMTIQTMDPASWSAFVQTGHKQDALAYKAGGQLGLTFEPSSQIGEFGSGNPNNWSNVNDPNFDKFNTQSLAATSVSQVKQILKDENLYVAQQHYVISLLQPNLFNFAQPWLHGYIGQIQSIPFSGGAGFQVGFYSARWWVDQTLKTKMGH